MITEIFLDYLDAWLFCLPGVLLLSAVITGVFYGIPRLCEKHPNRCNLWICRVIRALAIAAGVLLLLLLLAGLLWRFATVPDLVIIAMLIAPGLLIPAVIHTVKILKSGQGKKQLAIVAICLAAAVLTDVSVYFLSRRPDNIFEEIYYDMRDVKHPGKSKLYDVGTFELWYADDIFGSPQTNSESTSAGDFTYTEILCEYSFKIYCIFESKQLVFYHEPIEDVSWAMYVYDLRSKELSYSSSRGSGYERDPFLNNILGDWLRASALTLLHGIYTCGGLPLLIVAIFWGNSSFGIAEIFIYAALLTPPMLFGLFLVNRPKWWLISLPVQFSLNMIATLLLTRAPNVVVTLLYTAIPLAAQAIGAGIGLLIRRVVANMRGQHESDASSWRSK